jgi:hypothetical protein
MSSTRKARAGIVAAATTGVLAVAVAGATMANAADDPVTPSASPSGSTQGWPQRADEEELTGETADKVRAAVEAAYPDATIVRMETDADGGGVYEAHIEKSDGTHAIVLLDADFVVTGETTGGPGGPGGRGPGGHMGAEVTGDAADKVTAAATAAVEGMTVDHVVQREDGTYVALGHKADGTRVAVSVQADFTGAEVLELPDRGMGGPGGPAGPVAEQLSGTTAAKVRKAAKKRFPNATVDMLVKTPDGSYAALVTKGDGTRVVVKVSKKFAVTGTETPRFRGHGPAAPTTGTSTSGASA